MTVSLLQQRVPGAASLDEVYSVPIGVETYLASVTICNTSGAAREIRLAIAKGGGVDARASYVLYDAPLPAQTTLEWSQSQEVVLVAGDAIRIYANGTDVAFGVFGRENHLT